VFLYEIPASKDDVQSAILIYPDTFNHLVDNGVIIFHFAGFTVSYDLLELLNTAVILLVRLNIFLEFLSSALQKF